MTSRSRRVWPSPDSGLLSSHSHRKTAVGSAATTRAKRWKMQKPGSTRIPTITRHANSNRSSQTDFVPVRSGCDHGRRGRRRETPARLPGGFLTSGCRFRVSRIDFLCLLLSQCADIRAEARDFIWVVFAHPRPVGDSANATAHFLANPVIVFFPNHAPSANATRRAPWRESGVLHGSWKPLPRRRRVCGRSRPRGNWARGFPRPAPGASGRMEGCGLQGSSSCTSSSTKNSRLISTR